MNLLSLYNEIDDILNRLDFSQLYPHFKKYRFALYDPNEICLDGKIIPYDKRFLANTALLYEGEYLAIWNIGPNPEDAMDTELLAYSIVHEMFHCFQHENCESRFPDDLKLLGYPADLDNFRQKYFEDRCLARAFSHSDRESLIRFCEIRNARLASHGNVLQEELNAETAEGMAEFVGLKALRILNEDKYDEITLGYLDKLENSLSLLFDVRKISYYTGAILGLTLEKLGFPVLNDFHGQSVYSQGMPAVCALQDEGGKPPAAIFQTDDTDISLELTRQFDELMLQREHIISAHMADSNYIAYPSVICGYDPMNMFRSRDFIYCSHFIFLQNDVETVKRDGPVLLVLKDGAEREVEGFYVKGI